MAEDAKSFLKRVRIYDTHINSKLEDLHHLKDLATKVTTSYGAEPVACSGNSDKIGDVVACIVDLENEINREIDAFIDLKRQANDVINKVKHPDQLKVLYLRYFQYKQWEQIALEMCMTYRNVCYIHGNALQTVTRILKGENDEGH